MPGTRLQKRSRLSLFVPKSMQKDLPSVLSPTATAALLNRRASLPRTPLAEIKSADVENAQQMSMDLPRRAHEASDDPADPLRKLHDISKQARSNSLTHEHLRNSSISSEMSSRRGSAASKRKRGERRSDASSLTERRASHPQHPVLYRNQDYTADPSSQTLPPNIDPRIYDQLNSFSFGAPPKDTNPAYNVVQTTYEARRPGSPHSSSDEEERHRGERAKLRAMDDGSRRPSLPINIPQPDIREGRRSSLLKIASSANDMQVDDPEYPDPLQTRSLPNRLDPKPLPALPLLAPASYDHQTLAASAAMGGYDLRFILDSDAPSPHAASDASSAGGDDRERSPPVLPPATALLDSAQMQQAVLDHAWGTAFNFPGNLSPRGSIDDAFSRMVDQLDPTYKSNRHGWTFKRHPLPYPLRKPKPPPLPTTEDALDAKEKSPEPEQRQESWVWDCRNIGKYAYTPGKSHLGEKRRPYVVTGITKEGGRRNGPAYLIHKHSRCHAFSIFQGYHVKSQKISASNAILLASRDLQISFANAPENRPKPPEPYEEDPEVQKLQVHNLIEDEASASNRLRTRGHTVHASTSQTASPASARSKSTRVTGAEARASRTTGPSAFTASVDSEKKRIAQLIDKEQSIITDSTITPAPKLAPHSVAFDVVDHSNPMDDPNALRPGASTGFNWLRRAFGSRPPPNSASPSRPSTAGGASPPSSTLDNAYSPPWLLMVPSSVRQEEERMIKNLNDSFRAVGLIPPPKPRPSQAELSRQHREKMIREQKLRNRGLLESVPSGAMMMLLPLWVAEGQSAGEAGLPSKHHTQMTDRTYLLVFYVPFDNRRVEERSSRAHSNRTKGRPGRQRSTDRTLKRPMSHGVMGDHRNGNNHGRTHSEENAERENPASTSFRINARYLTYSEVKDCGIKLPRHGLAVDGPLSEALLDVPTAREGLGSYSTVVAMCHGRESGLQLLTDGLDRLGLRKQSLHDEAEEQQIALAAMEMDADALQADLEAALEPLSPIGKAVVETLLVGTLSILDFGFY